MRKKHFRKIPIPVGEDTPCKECAVYLYNGFWCTGDCRLRRRWRLKPVVFELSGRTVTVECISGYIYRNK